MYSERDLHVFLKAGYLADKKRGPILRKKANKGPPPMDFEEFQRKSEEKIQEYWAKMNSKEATKESIKVNRGRL